MKRIYVLTLLLCTLITHAVPIFAQQQKKITLSTSRPATLMVKIPRVPAKGIDIYIENHTVSFNAFTEDCIIEVSDDDDTVIYSENIKAGQTSCELPVTLWGNFTICISFENVKYYGEITL